MLTNNNINENNLRKRRIKGNVSSQELIKNRFQ